LTGIDPFLGFAAEANKSDVAKSNSWNICPCPEFKDTPIRIPNCQCNNAPDVSPLLQIRWKRLVIDEGHVAAATSTNLAEVALLISAERRWIVTGTPTTNLLGLSFGRNIEQGETLDAALEPPSSSTSDNSPSIPPSIVDDTENHAETARQWTVDDREDLRKLATMMTHFLKVPHFAANPKLLNHVTSPLLDTLGPRPGAIQVLNQVMSMIMIRHQ
jgi:SNF2-related domain